MFWLSMETLWQYSGSQHSQFHELFFYINDEEEHVSRSKGTFNLLKLSLLFAVIPQSYGSKKFVNWFMFE